MSLLIPAIGLVRSHFYCLAAAGQGLRVASVVLVDRRDLDEHEPVAIQLSRFVEAVLLDRLAPSIRSPRAIHG